MSRCIWFLAIVALVTFARPSHGQPARIDALERGNVVPGELVVTFRPGRTSAQQAAAVQAFGGEIFGRIPALDLVAVRFAQLDGATNATATANLMEALERVPEVRRVEPNYRYTLIDSISTRAPTPHATPEALAQQQHLPLVWLANGASFVPNDPYLHGQYAWSTIRAYQGWPLDHHFAGVVAVVDTGVQLDHPDLQAHLVAGYDVVDNDTTPQDGHGHGTHVAGTIAAVTDNNMGVAGTCPACRIMPVRVLNDWGQGTAFDVAQGIVFAAEHGAQVINLSLGGWYSELIEEALAYAWQRGSVLACAAGNDAMNDPQFGFPASDDHCIAVAASTVSDELAWFSNYGQWVDIAAPGEFIYSTYLDDQYIWASGTSMAAPHVAGVAGLLAGSGLNNAQIRARLLSTADPISGTGSNFMNGRLNMYRALSGN